MTDIDARTDRVLRAIHQPGPVDPPYDGPEPDPPHSSDAESDRAADAFERELDARWERAYERERRAGR